MSYSVKILSNNLNSMDQINNANLNLNNISNIRHSAVNDELVTLSVPAKNQKRIISVNGHGELSMPPDKVKLVLIIKSTKENIEDAKQSVHRRFEYIYQTMRKNKIHESNISVAKIYYRLEKSFEVITEVSAIFNDLNKFQQIYNIMIEKLDKTVKVREPEFFHSSTRLEAIKHQASMLAIKNAKRSAIDLARSVNLVAGKPIEISEEKIKEEWGDTNESHMEVNELKSLAQLLKEKTIKIIVNVNVKFELRQSSVNRE